MPKRSRAPETPTIDPEQEVFDRARLGDLRSWDLVVRHNQEGIFRVARLLTLDDASAVETTKTTFIRAYRALPDVPRGSAIRPWLVGIASSIARTQRRTLDRWYDRDSRKPVTADEPRLHASPVPGWTQVASLHPDVRDQLRSGFDLLTWEERLAVAARYLVALSRSDAATLLQMEPDEVELTLNSALDHLRSSFSDPHLTSLPSDHVGWLVIASIIGPVRWTPNVAPGVADRLMRDAITYPEQFGPTRRAATIGGLAAIPIESAAGRASVDRR